MFHFHSYANAGPLRQLLKKHNKTLEDVLDQEAVVTETKSANQNLINYFLQDNVFKQLINWMTKIPALPQYKNNVELAEQCDKNNKYTKYPYNACEILSSEVDKLANYMLGIPNDPISTKKSNNNDDDDDKPEYFYDDDDSNEKNSDDEVNGSDDGEDNNELNNEFSNVAGVNNNQEGNNVGSGSGNNVKEGLFHQPQVHEYFPEKVEGDSSMTQCLLPIDHFIRFLDTKKPLNLTLAGYFAKVLRNLFYFRPKILSDYLYIQNPQYIEQMSNHIYSDSIMEVFSVLIRLDHSLFKDTNQQYYVDIRSKIIENIVNNLRYPTHIQSRMPYLDEDSIYQLVQNSSLFLAGLIRNRNINAAEIILQPIMNLELFNGLLEILQNDKKSSNIDDKRISMFIEPIFNMIEILCEYFLELQQQKQGGNENLENSNDQTNSYDIYTNNLNNFNSDHGGIGIGLNNNNNGNPPIEINLESGFNLDSFTDKVLLILPDIMACLIDNDQLIHFDTVSIENKNEEMIIQEVENVVDKEKNSNSAIGAVVDFRFGYKTKLFGKNNIKLIELTYNFLKLNNPKINTKLADLRYFKILLDAFIREEWNNMLHNIVLKILLHVICNKDIDVALLQSLFDDARLLDFILQVTNDPDFVLTSKLKNKVRKGYLGHIVKISNSIENCKNPYITQLKSQNQGWQEYTQKFLKKSNDNDATKIGGCDPRFMPTQYPNAFFFGGLNHFNLNIHQESNNNNNDSSSNDDKPKFNEIESENNIQEDEEENNDKNMEDENNTNPLNYYGNHNDDKEENYGNPSKENPDDDNTNQPLTIESLVVEKDENPNDTLEKVDNNNKGIKQNNDKIEEEEAPYYVEEEQENMITE